MTGLLRCFRRVERCRARRSEQGSFRRNEQGSFHRNERGSLTVESMLTLPILLLALFLCIGLIYSIHGLLVLDHALAETCNDLAESSYLMQQAWGLGMDVLGGNERVMSLLASTPLEKLAGRLGGYALATNCMGKYTRDYPDIGGAVRWRFVRLPGLGSEDFPENGAGQPGVTSDVLLTLAGLLDGGSGMLSDLADVLVGESGASRWEDMTFDDDDVVLILTFTPAKLNRFTSLLPRSWEITLIKRQRAWLTGRNLLPHRGLEQAVGQRDRGPLVYITRWGEKYHLDECRYLAKSKIPAYLNQLSDAYGACLICKPPQRS